MREWKRKLLPGGDHPGRAGRDVGSGHRQQRRLPDRAGRDPRRHRC